MAQYWQTTRFELDLSTPLVMGIVNITPDSFSTPLHGESSHALTRAAIELAQTQLKSGAQILDLGAESTRPGAQALAEQAEWSRLEPVLHEVLGWGLPISVDTYKPGIMKRALAMGVDIINDVFAARQAGALAVVQAFLGERIEACLGQGIGLSRLMLDPGIGFGKTPEQNFELLAHQGQLHVRGLPLLVGWSRKSSLGVVTGLAVGERLIASVTAAVLAMDKGAQVLRVHDVKETLAAKAVWLAQRLTR